MTVDLALSQALKTAGFPQDSFPQMVWMQVKQWLKNEDGTEREDAVFESYEAQPPGNYINDVRWWCAAPDLLAAIMWLETQGFAVEYHSALLGGKPAPWKWAWMRLSDKEPRWHTADTPEALAWACLKAMKERA